MAENTETVPTKEKVSVSFYFIFVEIRASA